MKRSDYFKYFRFIWQNWNLRLAIFTIFHEVRGEKKYSINTTSVNDLKYLEIVSGNKKSAYIYQPVNYFMVETALKFLKSQNIDGGLVDFGCGKGRILAVAAHYGFKRITGIEFAPQLCNDAQKNLEGIKKAMPEVEFKVVCDNAINYKISGSDTVFVFFNPFDETVMLPVIKNILQSVKEVNRAISVCYFNPTEKEIFLSAGFREIWYYKRMQYLDFSILQLS